MAPGLSIRAQVVLDAHLHDVPGDRHPNLAGYHVIGDEAAKFLAPLMRKRPAESS